MIDGDVNSRNIDNRQSFLRLRVELVNVQRIRRINDGQQTLATIVWTLSERCDMHIILQVVLCQRLFGQKFGMIYFGVKSLKTTSTVALYSYNNNGVYVSFLHR